MCKIEKVGFRSAKWNFFASTNAIALITESFVVSNMRNDMFIIYLQQMLRGWLLLLG